MQIHANATLGPAGRVKIVRAVEGGLSQKQAAACFCVSPSTVNRWWRRWRAASDAERGSLACLEDRSSRPRRSPTELPQVEQRRICEVRDRTGWGPRLIAGVVCRPHSTVHATLARHGRSRRPRPPRESVCRYEWPCPGDLLHIDVKRYARFERPGHAVTANRFVESRGAGYEFAHSIVDDHSRLAYSELLGDERAQTVVGFVSRALDWFQGQGVVARRVMSDNAWTYTKNRALARLLAERGVRHLLTEPRRPQTNGKVERFQQTMAREWAYGLAYRTSADRARALPHWLSHYNGSRPHSGIGNVAPVNRVRDVSGQDS